MRHQYDLNSAVKPLKCFVGGAGQNLSQMFEAVWLQYINPKTSDTVTCSSCLSFFQVDRLCQIMHRSRKQPQHRNCTLYSPENQQTFHTCVSAFLGIPQRIPSALTNKIFSHILVKMMGFNLHLLLYSEGQEETEWWLKTGFEAVLKEVTQ